MKHQYWTRRVSEVYNPGGQLILRVEDPRTARRVVEICNQLIDERIREGTPEARAMKISADDVRKAQQRDRSRRWRASVKAGRAAHE